MAIAASSSRETSNSLTWLNGMCEQLLHDTTKSNVIRCTDSVINSGYGLTVLLDALRQRLELNHEATDCAETDTTSSYSLELVNGPISTSGAKRLALLLWSTRTAHGGLYRLQLTNAQSRGLATTSVLEALTAQPHLPLPSLQVLELSNDTMVDPNMLERVLTTNTRLRQLSLCNLPQLGSTSASSTTLSPTASALLRGLNVNRTLTSLRLSRCRLDDAFCLALAAMLNSTAITELDLFRNDISDSGAAALVDTLCLKQSRLTKLCLAQNRLSTQGLQLVVDALPRFRSLQELDLYHAELLLPLEQCQALAGALDTNTSLAAVSLGCCDFSPNKDSLPKPLLLKDEFRSVVEAPAFQEARTVVQYNLALNRAGRRPHIFCSNHDDMALRQDELEEKAIGRTVAEVNVDAMANHAPSLSRLAPRFDHEAGLSGVYYLLRQRPDLLL